jgi:hypothetical protein
MILPNHDVSNSYRFFRGWTLQVNRIILASDELWPISHFAGKVGREREVREDVYLAIHANSLTDRVIQPPNCGNRLRIVAAKHGVVNLDASFGAREMLPSLDG